MAKKRSENPVRKALSLEMRKHVGAFGGAWRYSEWCFKNGFRKELDKTPKEIAAEQAVHATEKRRVEINAKLHRNPKKLIEEMCLGRISSADIDRPQWKELAHVIEKSPSDARSRESLRKLLLRVHAVADFLFGNAEFAGWSFPYAKALVHLNERRREWRRDIEAWKPTTHNAGRQFASLVRHLVADYPVPAFMDQVWFKDGKYGAIARGWYMHVGAGKNIRTARMPVPLTKMMAHHMMLAPDNYSIGGAIRWGQIHALGGDRTLADAIVGSRIGEIFANDEFWLSVFRFLIANPMFDRNQIGPLVDFLHHHKFEERRRSLARMAAFAWRRRCNQTCRCAAAPPKVFWRRWRSGIATSDECPKLPAEIFPRSGFSALEIGTGRDGKNVWTIRELLSSAELRKEGKSMRHCVASYARSCARGRCSIWSMELLSPLGIEKRQTIEVSRHGDIVQSRGKLNRMPTAGELAILQTWASRAGLRIAPHVRSMDKTMARIARVPAASGL